MSDTPTEPDDADAPDVPVWAIDLWCDWEAHEAEGMSWEEWQDHLREAGHAQ